MQDKRPMTQRRLMEEFPEIKADVAENIDIKTKTKILIYQSDNVNRDVSIALQEEIKKCVKTKNFGKIRKKCNKLASEYLENNRVWILQENWYCLLAYFVSIATMILRVLEVKTKTNDWISFVMYFVALLLWIIIVQIKRLMGLKAYRFLVAFNHHAPSVIIVNSFLFYMAVCLCNYRSVWIAVIVLSFVVCMWLTCLWYKRENEK